MTNVADHVDIVVTVAGASRWTAEGADSACVCAAAVDILANPVRLTGWVLCRISTTVCTGVGEHRSQRNNVEVQQIRGTIVVVPFERHVAGVVTYIANLNQRAEGYLLRNREVPALGHRLSIIGGIDGIRRGRHGWAGSGTNRDRIGVELGQ